MKVNLGTIDRAARLLLVAVIVILYLTDTITGTAVILLGLFSVILAITSLTGFCPLYYILKLSSIRRES